MSDQTLDAEGASKVRVAQHPHAIAADVNGEIVLMNIQSGYFYQLNAVGSYVWRQIAEPQTVAALCARAVHDFDADAAECRQDIGRFVRELHDNGLVTIE